MDKIMYIGRPSELMKHFVLDEYEIQELINALEAVKEINTSQKRILALLYEGIREIECARHKPKSIIYNEKQKGCPTGYPKEDTGEVSGRDWRTEDTEGFEFT